MKKTILLLLFFFSFFFKTIGQSEPDPEVTIVTSDIESFWNAYDKAKPKFRPSDFKNYLEQGTVGLNDFMSRIGSAKKLARVVKKKSRDYESIREASFNIIADEKVEIENVFSTLKELYPKTIYPKIYFVIGRMNSGGIPSENGIIIGYETLSVIGKESLMGLIVHEAVHFQENHNKEDIQLLGQCIAEGAADFISEIAIGENEEFSHHNDSYGLANEKELWRQFKKDMDNKSLGNWLYGGSVLKNSPEHMGYWMCYQIVKAFYLKQDDKKAAIAEILNIKNFNKFLELSDYAKKFE